MAAETAINLKSFSLIFFLGLMQSSFAAQTINDQITQLEYLDEKYKEGLIAINNQRMKDRMASQRKEDRSKQLAIKAKLANDKYQKQKKITEKAVRKAAINNVSGRRYGQTSGFYRFELNIYEREARKEERKLRVYKRELDMAVNEAGNGYSNAAYLDDLKSAKSKRNLASWYAQQKRAITEKETP